MSVRKSGSRAVSLKSSALPEAIRPAQCWSLGSQSPTRSGRLKARTCWRRTSGWKSGLDSSAICIAAGYAATGKIQAYSCLGRSGAGLLQSPSDSSEHGAGGLEIRRPKTENRKKSEARNPRRTSAADRASRQRGQSFRTSDFGVPSDFGFRPSDLGWQRPTLEHPWYWGDDRTEHRHPISKGGAKPPKATPRPPQGHILGIDSGVQRHPKATSRPPQGLLIANRLGPQSHPKATSKPPQGYPKATPRLHQI